MSNHNVLTEKYSVYRLVPGPDGELTQYILQPGEFFVLRKSDLFASGTLRAYAGAILTFMESAETEGVEVAEDLLVRMEKLLNYTSALATEWEQVTSRLPD